MAETATKTTTPRSRARKPAGATAAKTTTTAAKAQAAPVETEDKMRLQFSLAYLGDTKNYATFDLSKDVNGNATGCVGKFYAPLGTEEVKVLVIGPAAAVAGE